jgi:aromatic ring hydroxylase
MTKEQLQQGQDILQEISNLTYQLNQTNAPDNYNSEYPFSEMAAPYIKKYMLGYMANFKSQYKEILENQIDILKIQFENL